MDKQEHGWSDNMGRGVGEYMTILERRIVAINKRLAEAEELIKRINIEMGEGGKKAYHRAIDCFSARLVKAIQTFLAPEKGEK